MAKIVNVAGIARDAAVARAKFYLFDPGVYTGSAELKDGPLRIWPIATHYCHCIAMASRAAWRTGGIGKAATRCA